MANSPTALSKDDLRILKTAMESHIASTIRAQKSAKLPELAPVYEKELGLCQALLARLLAA